MTFFFTRYVQNSLKIESGLRHKYIGNIVRTHATWDNRSLLMADNIFHVLKIKTPGFISANAAPHRTTTWKGNFRSVAGWYRTFEDCLRMVRLRVVLSMKISKVVSCMGEKAQWTTALLECTVALWSLTLNFL